MARKERLEVTTLVIIVIMVIKVIMVRVRITGYE